LVATAAGPMATELAPVAVLSARVELAWKYLIPAPLASALSVVRLVLTLERPVESEVTPLALALMPLDAEVERVRTPVESEPTLLALVLIPEDAEVESDPTELALVLMPDEADVESDPTELLVDDRPVESEVTPLALVLMPLDADVERDPT